VDERVRVAVDAGWTTPAGAYDAFLRYTEGGSGRYRDLELTQSEHDVLLLFNAPARSDYDPARAIVFESEPRSTREAEFRYPFRPDEYLAFYDLERHHFVGEWFVHPSRLGASPEKTKTISTITSGIGVLPRHRLRRDFVADWLRRLDDLDDFGRSGAGFVARRGELADKADGLLPYRYTFAAENFVEPNYFTEKLLDPLLCECLVFYDGCPNLELHVDPDVFVAVDMTRPAEALETIREAIAADLWSARREALRGEGERLRIAMNPLEIARRLIHGEPNPWRAAPGPPEATLRHDPHGSFLGSAPDALAALRVPPGEAVVIGGRGMRFPELGFRDVELTRTHRLRPLVPGTALHGTAVAGAGPVAWAIDPPLFYVPGPHMLGAEGAPIVTRAARPGPYQAAERAIKRLPRGQRVARKLLDGAVLAYGAARSRRARRSSPPARG
jgi:hypothetical protein